MKVILSVDDLHYRTEGTTILDSVKFQLRAGEYLSIVGPNGAGKSTLLKCLIRILQKTSGKIWVHGAPIESFKQRDLARVLAYVPQTSDAKINFLVFDFVLMGRYPYLATFETYGQDDIDAAMAAMDLTGILPLKDRNFATLSGGERQKVLIAAAIAQQTDILLFDEPVTFLDPKYQTEIERLLKQINVQSQIAIVSVTHHVNTAVMVSDRILALKDGRALYDGLPSEMMNNEVLSRIYDKDFLFAEHPQSGAPIIIPELIS